MSDYENVIHQETKDENNTEDNDKNGTHKIAKVKIADSSIHTEEWYLIATFEKRANPKLFGVDFILSPMSPMGKIILENLAASNDDVFPYEDLTGEIFYYYIDEKQIYDEDIIKSFKLPEDIFFNKDSVSIYVVSRRVPCEESSLHESKTVIAHVLNETTNKEIMFNATYCITCDKYIVHRKALEKYIHLGHVLNANFRSYTRFSSNGWQEESPLALYGYNVQRNVLSTYRRQEILVFIIENDILSCGAIIGHLEQMISLREMYGSERFSDAIAKWKEDIDFVFTYFDNNSDHISGDFMF